MDMDINANPIDNSQSKGTAQSIVAQEVQITHSGPLPHPSVLKGYSEIDPTFPERIMKMAEDNNKATIDHEEQVIKKTFSNQKLGIFLSFILGLSGLIVGVALSVAGYPTAAITSIIAACAPVLIASISSIAGNGKSKNEDSVK